MKFFRQNLFWKIFLWFWATVVLIAATIVVAFLLDPGQSTSPLHAGLLSMARYSAVSVVQEAELHGVEAASSTMQQQESRTHAPACLATPSGSSIAGDGCTLLAAEILRARATQTDTIAFRRGVARVALPIQGARGGNYIYAAEISIGATGIHRSAVATRFLIALFVSFCICYWLTNYLTAPILRLREASQRLAAGDLSSRAAPALERRNDELGFLIRDFNAMAGRIEELVSRQRQLIYDLSHELRSPLARLGVALDLARERKGPDAAFDHADQDLERMNEMIGRMLTVARLDTPLADVQTARVDLGKLVAQIARSAAFEMREREDAIRLTIAEPCFVHGNAELLHSAFENIIRNAIRYTAPDTSVEVDLRPTGQSANQIHLSVRDHGPGVPEAELASIFQPFYRVAGDRARQSGGVGLGLAIADRVVRAHAGSIRARNHAPHGLCVDILLPAEKF